MSGGLLHARLGHTIGHENVWPTYRATSVQVFPIDIRRPEHGFAEQIFVCGYCGTEVALVVHDARRTAALRRRWLGLGLLGSLICLVGVLGLMFPVGDITAGSALLGGLAAVIVTGLVLALGFLRLWRIEDGVRCAPRNADHTVWPAFPP